MEFNGGPRRPHTICKNGLHCLFCCHYTFKYLGLQNSVLKCKYTWRVLDLSLKEELKLNRNERNKRKKKIKGAQSKILHIYLNNFSLNPRCLVVKYSDLFTLSIFCIKYKTMRELWIKNCLYP